MLADYVEWVSRESLCNMELFYLIMKVQEFIDFTMS